MARNKQTARRPTGVKRKADALAPAPPTANTQTPQPPQQQLQQPSQPLQQQAPAKKQRRKKNKGRQQPQQQPRPLPPPPKPKPKSKKEREEEAVLGFETGATPSIFGSNEDRTRRFSLGSSRRYELPMLIDSGVPIPSLKAQLMNLIICTPSLIAAVHSEDAIALPPELRDEVLTAHREHGGRQFKAIMLPATISTTVGELLRKKQGVKALRLFVPLDLSGLPKPPPLKDSDCYSDREDEEEGGNEDDCEMKEKSDEGMNDEEKEKAEEDNKPSIAIPADKEIIIFTDCKFSPTKKARKKKRRGKKKQGQRPPQRKQPPPPPLPKPKPKTKKEKEQEEEEAFVSSGQTPKVYQQGSVYYGKGLLHSRFGKLPDAETVSIFYNHNDCTYVSCDDYEETVLAKGGCIVYEPAPDDTSDAEFVEGTLHPSELVFNYYEYNPGTNDGEWCYVIMSGYGYLGGLGNGRWVLGDWLGEMSDHQFEYCMKRDPMYKKLDIPGLPWISKYKKEHQRLSLLRCGLVEDPELKL